MLREYAGAVQQAVRSSARSVFTVGLVKAFGSQRLVVAIDVPVALKKLTLIKLFGFAAFAVDVVGVPKCSCPIFGVGFVFADLRAACGFLI